MIFKEFVWVFINLTLNFSHFFINFCKNIINFNKFLTISKKNPKKVIKSNLLNSTTVFSIPQVIKFPSSEQQSFNISHLSISPMHTHGAHQFPKEKTSNEEEVRPNDVCMKIYSWKRKPNMISDIVAHTHIHTGTVSNRETSSCSLFLLLLLLSLWIIKSWEV